jgi:hypothetical protein
MASDKNGNSAILCSYGACDSNHEAFKIVIEYLQTGVLEFDDDDDEQLCALLQISKF